jgi:hypothetical protein
MSFTLQILDDDRTRYTATNIYRQSPSEFDHMLRGTNASAPYADAPGYRIINNNSYRSKPLCLRPKFRKPRKSQANNCDRIDVHEQARRAAALLLQRGPGPVSVFPCGGTGHSNDFRYYLSLHILGEPSREWGQDWNARRRKNEERCADVGYPFEEVDPEDWK